MLPRNSRTEFFKYLTADAGKAVLRHRTLKWSTPALFNDPFDNQIDILLDDLELMASQSFDHFLANVTGDTPVQYHTPVQTVITEMLRQAVMSGRVVLSDADLAGFKQSALEGAQNAAARLPETNAEFRKQLADTSIFCMTEDHNNNVMWAHYSGNHTGIAIKLAPTHDDCFLTVAQKVMYAEQLRKFTAIDFMNPETMAFKAMEYINFTKSVDWAYEKEWRVVSGLRDKSKQYELIPFAKEELGAVYLGCRISEADKLEIVELVHSNFPHAQIYQAAKHPEEFSLVFTEHDA